MDYNKETLVSTTSSTTDGGSRTQTLKRSVHNDLRENEEQGKLNEVGPLYSTHCMHVCISNFHAVLIFVVFVVDLNVMKTKSRAVVAIIMPDQTLDLQYFVLFATHMHACMVMS